VVNPFEVVKVTLQANRNAFAEVGDLLHSSFLALLDIMHFKVHV